MEIKLSKRQRAILVGNILGDGHLEFNGHHGTRMQIKQCLRYKKYVWWLHNGYKNLCKSIPKQRKDNDQWYFGTRYINELTEFRNIFYNRNNIKIIPKNITAFLTEPISLAVWYMDDGKLDYRPKDHYAFSLTINNFLLKEAKILSDMLLKNFGVISSIQNPLCRGKRYPMLYIGKNGRDKFLKIVKPHIIDCFSHKLPPIL